MDVYYLNNKPYTKDDINVMSIMELEELALDIQQEVQRQVIIRKRLFAKGNRGLNNQDKHKLLSCDTKISIYSQMAAYVSFCKKKQRDTMQRERDWYREFYKYSRLFIKERDLENFQKKVSEKLGYTIENLFD